MGNLVDHIWHQDTCRTLLEIRPSLQKYVDVNSQNYSAFKHNKIRSIISPRTFIIAKTTHPHPSSSLGQLLRDHLAGYVEAGVPATFARKIVKNPAVRIPLWVYLPTRMLPSLSKDSDLAQRQASLLFTQAACLLCRKGNILPLHSQNDSLNFTFHMTLIQIFIPFKNNPPNAHILFFT